MKDICDLTLPIGEAIRYPRTLPTTIVESRCTADHVQMLSEVSLSPHAVTHLDLPWSINWSETCSPTITQPPKEDSEDAYELVQHYATPRTRDTIIIDVSEKVERVRQLLRTDDNHLRLPFRDLWRDSADNSLQPEQVIVKALKELRIGKEHLSMLPRMLTNTVILFYTGWRYFTPVDLDVGHPLWADRHPLCLSPFLDYSAVEMLLERGACGVGTDVHSLDTPVHWIIGQTRGNADVELSRAVEAQDLVTWHDGESVKYLPVHTLFLSRKFDVLEHVHIPYRLFRHTWPGVGRDASAGGFRFIRGRLGIFPLPCADEREALLATVLFTPGEELDG